MKLKSLAWKWLI